MNDNITKDQVLAAYNNAPDFVRAAFNDEKTTQVVIELRAKFQLHVDNAGLLGKGVGHMLLGLVNPQEFLQELIAAKVPEKDAREIMTEINQKIFVPLREQMRSGAETKQEPAKPVMTAPQPQPQSAAAQPPRPNWGSHKPLAVANPPQVQSGRPDLRNLLASITAEVPKSIESRKLLEDHEEPSPSLKATESTAHIEFNKPPAVPRIVVPLPPPPAPQRIAPPPPNPPGVMPEKPVVSGKVQGASSPAKPYSVDPYREPIDEK